MTVTESLIRIQPAEDNRAAPDQLLELTVKKMTLIACLGSDCV